jgi:hypothetical protein
MKQEQLLKLNNSLLGKQVRCTADLVTAGEIASPAFSISFKCDAHEEAVGTALYALSINHAEVL